MLSGGDAAQMAALSAAMRRAWIAFVRTGDPAHDALPDWPRYTPSTADNAPWRAHIGVVGDPACIGTRPTNSGDGQRSQQVPAA